MTTTACATWCGTVDATFPHKHRCYGLGADGECFCSYECYAARKPLHPVSKPPGEPVPEHGTPSAQAGCRPGCCYVDEQMGGDLVLHHQAGCPNGAWTQFLSSHPAPGSALPLPGPPTRDDVGICDRCGIEAPLVEVHGPPINGGFCGVCSKQKAPLPGPPALPATCKHGKVDHCLRCDVEFACESLLTGSAAPADYPCDHGITGPCRICCTVGRELVAAKEDHETIAALRRDLAEARTELAAKEAEMRAWEVDMRQLGARLAVTVGALERIGKLPDRCREGEDCPLAIARAALAPTGAPTAKETT